MKYVCLVYFDPRDVFSRSREAAGVLADSPAYDAELRTSGALVMAQALSLPSEAATVRVRGGQATWTDGPFTETKEVLGGLIIIEARDLEEAREIAAGIPLARLGCVELRPVVDYSKPRPVLS